MIETEKKIEIRAGECCAIIRQKITMATITQYTRVTEIEYSLSYHVFNIIIISLP